tara:strand:+ start:1099 stop:3021 length:1923 start_codon:yes stop_codon:yes gene_type:complete
MIPAFNGGLNTRVDAHLIDITESRNLVNVDTDSAILRPIRDKLDVEQAVDRYCFYNTLDDTWYSEAVPTDWVIFNNVLYKSTRSGVPTKIINGVESQLGIDVPVGTMLLAPTSAPDPISGVSIVESYNDSADLPGDTTLRYKIVNKDSTTGLESVTYFEDYVTYSTVVPEKVSTDRSGSILASKPFAGRIFKLVIDAKLGPSNNRLTITVTDAEADLVRIYRYHDGYWRALTNDFQSAATAVVDDTYDISGNDALDESLLITGTIQYALRYKNSTTGVVSGPLLSTEIEVINGEVALSNIPVSSDTQVDKKELFRVGGNLTNFSLVAELDNATTTYLDDIPDNEVIGTILTSTDALPAPEGLQYLTEAYAMLFGSVGNQLRFTPIGEPDSWPVNYFLEFPEVITGISKTAIGLLVHTYYTTYLITGTGPTSLTQQPLSGDQGCVSHDTIRMTKDTAIWVSTDGICASDGSDVKVISKDKLGKIDLSSAVNAILYDQVYQVLLSSNLVYALDFEFGLFKQFNYGVDYLHVANDAIYGHNEGKLYQINAAETNLSIQYQSPDFALQGLTTEKIYTRVYAFTTGEMTLSVYIDGSLVKTYTLDSGMNDRAIPENKKRGNYISFGISGSNSVRELKWDSAVSDG